MKCSKKMSGAKEKRMSKWLQQIKQTQKDGEERVMPSIRPSIFKIPDTLRVERPEAYEPLVVSLGPHHHFKQNLYESESYKSRLTIQLERKANKGPFQCLVEDIISIAGDIRNCYDDDIECSDEVLGWTMARDAVFLLEVLGCHDRHSENGTQEASLDGVFHPGRKSPLFFPLQADIFKLENQIPLFILTKVLAWETGSELQASEMIKTATIEACRQFSPFLRVGGSFRPTVGLAYDDVDPEKRHLLEWLYNSVVPLSFRRNLSNEIQINVSLQHDTEGTVHRYSIFPFFVHITSKLTVSFSSKSFYKADANLPSAWELHRRGVKFAPFTWASEDIRFDRATATLFLPCIDIDYRTDVFLRNLIAVEAYMKCTCRVFTCYVDLMDRLVDTPKDVAVLKKHGIIYSNLGSDKEVCTLWNGIRRSIWRSAYDPIDQTIRDVNKYYQSRYRVMLGEFMQEHFSKPWRAISVVGACILLLLALLQTIISYLQLRSACPGRK